MKRSRGLKLLAAIPITVTPSPPPGTGKIVSTLLTRLILIGWIVVGRTIILSGIYLALGDSEKGKKYISGYNRGHPNGVLHSRVERADKPLENATQVSQCRFLSFSRTHTPLSRGR